MLMVINPNLQVISRYSPYNLGLILPFINELIFENLRRFKVTFIFQEETEDAKDLGVIAKVMERRIIDATDGNFRIEFFYSGSFCNVGLHIDTRTNAEENISIDVGLKTGIHMLLYVVKGSLRCVEFHIVTFFYDG